MNPEQWRKLQELFEEVTQSPPAEREAALQRVAETMRDPSLIQELRRLIEHSEPDPEFLRPIQALGSEILRAGDVVAGRFEIVRLISRGGMGAVFEAIDRKLGEPVAIKVIAPEYARDRKLLERFLREVQIARRISHPNICRIHDLGEHGGVPYLSMELLEGETLATRLERGPIPLEEWESIARQLFDGLAAAHAAGVVHRDLKPSNLILAGPRLVILDFGLARPVLSQDDGGLTQSGTLVGTLDWMAPEQLIGEHDERSDVYSAALILVRMLKEQPWEHSGGGLVNALRRATSQTDFRKLLPVGIPAPWRYVLQRCLEREPERRPANAQAIQNLLSQPPRAVFVSLGSLIRSRWTKSAFASAIFLALIFAGFRYLGHPGFPPGFLIMVASTNNATGESRFDGITLALRADLAQASGFNVWDAQRLREALRSMRSDPQSRLDAKEWRQIALREHASMLVFSTLSRLGDAYTLTIRAEEIGSDPEPAQSWDRTLRAAGPSALFDAVHEAARWIRSTAGENAVELSAYNRSPQDITTGSWEALRVFDEAQTLSAAQRATDAIPLFERAVQLDPEFAMARMRLGDVLNAQYRSEEGFANWRQAVELARQQHLSEHERLNIESRYALEIRDFRGAEPVLREWVRKFPNDPTAPRLLASALLGQGHSDEAVAIARNAQERFGPTVFGTSILIRALASQNRYAEIEPQLQLLEGLSSRSLMLAFRGMLAAMKEDYENAAQQFRELAAANSGSVASRAMGLLAISEADRGNLEEARRILRAGITKDRAAGQDGLASQKTVALAFLEGQAGNKAAARALAEQAVAFVGASPQVILGSVTVLARHGDAAGAARLAKKFPGIKGPKFDVARLRMEGEIAAARGEYRKALDLLERAAQQDRVYDPREYLARALDLAGDRERARWYYQNIVDTPWLIWDLVEEAWPGTRFFAKQYLKK
jgi:eukaryotic-like serine/threonine-protein kinase